MNGSGNPWKMILAISLSAAGCTQVPIKMQCQELQSRIDYGNLTDDQLRFAKDELEDCHNRLNQAAARDSGIIDTVENRFTPPPQ